MDRSDFFPHQSGIVFLDCFVKDHFQHVFFSMGKEIKQLLKNTLHCPSTLKANLAANELEAFGARVFRSRDEHVEIGVLGPGNPTESK